MYKIVDLYNTRYFYVTYNVDLIYLFDTIIKLRNDPTASYHAGSKLHEELFKDVIAGKEVVIDLAGAKFTSDTTTTLTRYMREGIKFADTEDTVRNEILEEDVRRMAIDKTDYVLLPRFTNRTNIQEYLSSLKRDVVYTLPEMHEDLYIPLTILIILLRPTITIDMGHKDRTILSKVANHFTAYELKQYAEFYFISDEGVVELRPDISGKYSVQQASNLSIDDVLSYGNLVPLIFGKKRLVEEDPWYSLSEECLRIVDGYKLTYQPTIEEVVTNAT